jgi:N-sulfoglucosamine sulfohydrolase
MMNKVWCSLAIFLFLLTGCKSAHENSKQLKPNILLLISDDHSADDLGIVGKGRPHTPALDALAASGVRFVNAYASSPQCSPSRAALITGRSSHATGTSRLHSALTSEYETILESLKKSGYYVGAYRKVHLGESFQSRWNFFGDDNVPFDKFFRERPHDKPFFLWIGFHDPHRPYKQGAFSPLHNPADVTVPGFLPDNDAVRKDLVNYYDAISRMDSDVGKILNLLDSEKLKENTLVIFCGDNGMPFPGAKGTLYDAGVRVPLIMRWPGKIQSGQVKRDVVSLVDIAPTILNAASSSALPKLEGQNLFTQKDRPAFFERNWHDNLDFIRGVRSGNYLLIQNYRTELPYVPTLDLAESPTWLSIQDLHVKRMLQPELEQRYFAVPRPEVELYDLNSDPNQFHNLSQTGGRGDLPADLQSLQKLLSDWMISTNDFLPPPIPPQRGSQGEVAQR